MPIDPAATDIAGYAVRRFWTSQGTRGQTRFRS